MAWRGFWNIVASLPIGLADEGGGRSREGSVGKKRVLVAIEVDTLDISTVNR